MPLNPEPLPKGWVTATVEVSARPLTDAITRNDPADDAAVNRPPGVTVPPVAENTTLTAMLSPAVLRPYAENCLLVPGARVADAGTNVTWASTGALRPETLAHQGEQRNGMPLNRNGRQPIGEDKRRINSLAG